jgi:hypothetical protein
MVLLMSFIFLPLECATGVEVILSNFARPFIVRRRRGHVLLLSVFFKNSGKLEAISLFRGSTYHAHVLQKRPAHILSSLKMMCAPHLLCGRCESSRVFDQPEDTGPPRENVHNVKVDSQNSSSIYTTCC